MQPAFAREVLNRLPLAEGVLSLWRWICADGPLDDLFERHRGACYHDKIAFPTLVALVRDALLEHDGSGRKSFQRGRECGALAASVEAAYGKLGRLPLALSEAFLAGGAERLRELQPPAAARPVPKSLQTLRVFVVDGKAIKRVPKRLRPLRGRPGGLLGGKALVALELSSGLALGLAAAADGETNDAKLVPPLLPAVRARAPGCRLWVADRQFCDLRQAEAFTEAGDHFVVRYHPKTQFHPDPARPFRSGQDRRGRAFGEEEGCLGRPGNPRRRRVRRITLERPGEEAIVLITDLLDAATYPADDLLEVYLARWGIERVFQQITEVFALQRLIGTTPQGTVFQLAFCLLLYNIIQVVRAYVAAGQRREVETVSTELLFDDVRRQLTALHEVVAADAVAALFTARPTAEQLRARLGALLGSVWTERWRKAPAKRRKPAAVTKPSARDHTSVHRILEEHRGHITDSPSS